MKKKKDKEVDILVGYGALATFKKVKKGDDVMVRYGYIITAGTTMEEEKEKLEKDLEEILEDKPKSLIKRKNEV